MIIYSLPIGFEGSSLQSMMFGTGIVVLDRTKICNRVSSLTLLDCRIAMLTVRNSSNLGISGQPRRACYTSGKPGHNSLGIIRSKYDDFIKTSLMFLKACNRSGTGTGFNYLLAKQIEIEFNVTRVAF